MTKDEDLASVQKAIDELSEHFDSVHIFCTRYEGPDIGTVQVNRGTGNWYARSGQIQEWLIKNAEESRVTVRPDNPDDGWRNA